MRSWPGVVLGLLLLAGCDPRDSVWTHAADPGVAAERIRTAHLHRHLSQSPDRLDPAFAEDVVAMVVVGDLFEGLVRLDSAGRIVPGVAERWESTPDGLHWRFHLRGTARWSNGDAVTAADFVFAWRRVVEPRTASPLAQMMLPLAGAAAIVLQDAPVTTLGVAAPDAATLDVHLAEPVPYLLDLLANCWMMPVHEPTVRQHGARWTDPAHLVGNGAFTLRARTTNGPIRLERNPRYWNAAAVRLAAVTHHPQTDTAAATARYLAGDFDVTDRVQIDDLGWLRRRLDGQVRIAPQLGTFMLGINVTRPPLDDPRLRRALLLAVDREIITGRLLKGLFEPAYAVVPPLPGYPDGRPAWAGLDAAARHVEARRLYAEAGYSAARPLQLEIAHAMTDSDTRRVLEAIAAMWRLNLGAQVRLSSEESRVFRQNRALGRHGLFFFSWIGDYPDPLTFLELALPDSPQNHMRYRNAAYAAAVEAARRQPDPARRQAHYADAARMLDKDAVLVPVYYYNGRHLVRPFVHGWQGNLMDRIPSQDLHLAMPEGG